MKYDHDFKKSSFSQHGWGKVYCVEVKRTQASIEVRDSKHPDQVTLGFTHEEWDAFLKGVKNREFDI